MIFAPASITCIFCPEVSEDPLNSGSIGVGFTINMGVYAERGNGIEVNDEKRDFPTVEYVLRKLGLPGVKIYSDLPFGCGFGLSGASALTTAFLADYPAVELADIAHEAEVVNLTGLGDVVTQTFGGIVVRKNARCPSRAVVEKYTWKCELDFVVLGEIKTKSVIGDEVKRQKMSKAGKKWTKEFMRRPTLDNLFKCSNSFARETGLMDFVSDVIEAVESCGGKAAMAMLGKTVFTLNGFEALKEFGEPFRARIDCCGVRRVESGSDPV